LVETLRTIDPGLQYWNLARRSLKTAEVRSEQLDRALDLKPDLASVAVGMNDILGPDFDAGTYRRELAAIVEPLRRAGATVLMGSFPLDLPALRLMRRSSARKFRTRLYEASEAGRAVAAEHGALFMDAPDGWRYTMSECSLDGCHPNARGHVHIAQLALDGLCKEAGLDAAHIDRSDFNWWSTSAAHLRWLTTARRSTVTER
jgi:lysophospholipase L1-like esterase